jgi:hypothetical protein
MKTNILLTSFFFWLTGFAFANTYVWEDYDDFSGSTLDTSKWEAVYFAGGQEASIESGKVKLMGSAYYSGSPTKVPTALSAAVAGSTEGNAGILISDSTVFGIEVELTLPLANNSYEAGVFLDIKDTSPLRGLGHEIRYTSSGTSMGYSFLNTSGIKEYSSANASLDMAHKIRLTKISGKMTYFLDGNLLKEFTNNTYDSDYWLIGAFNDNGNSFVAFADNVRVLRQATTTSLDGSIFSLSSTDGVSETMSFENGTFTSTLVDSQKITTITSNQSYILDSMSSNNWKITLSDGDVYSFDSSAGTGTLTDYENGVIDTIGSWNFTYTRNTWEDYDDFSASSLDTNKWEVGYFAGGETVTVVNGQANLSGSTYSFSSPFQMPSELSAAGQGSTEGNTFLFIKDPTIIGLEAEIMIPNAGNQNEAGIYLTTLDSNPLGSLGFELRKTATGSSFNYDYFNDQGSKILGYEAGSLDTLHKIKMTELNGQTSYYLDNKLIKQFASTSHDSDYWGIGAFNDNGLAYITYADNVRILRQGTTTTQPDPVTVLSDPNGQAIVVQVGNEYQWNSTLDGVTLWSVDQSQSSGDIQPITMRFENGRNFGSEGFYDSIAHPQPYDMPFVIDENGYIKVSEDSGYQYYHVVSVENGIIATLEGDEQGVVDDGVSVADQWFFTTRAAAEEYYYAKVNPKDWMWFDHYPWVYSNEMKEWLYFMPSGGKLMYYSHKNKIWREFSQ